VRGARCEPVTTHAAPGEDIAATPRVHRLLSAALVLLACAPQAPPEGGPGRSTLRVVTWNVHDLFDEVDDAVPPGDQDTVLSAAEVDEELARVGEVLSRLDADVYVLEEVENLRLLQRLAGGPLAGRGYRAELREGFDPRGIDVGVLSRLPVEWVSHLEDRGPDGGRLWARDLAELHLELAPRPAVILGGHLVSRLDPSADGRRLQQAERVREILDQARAAPTRPIAMAVGDFNDVPSSAAMRPLLGDGALVDLGAMLPEAESWTWSGGSARERIDYAILSREDEGLVTRVEVVAGPEIAATSDHRPLLVDLWLDRQDRSVSSSGW
jgi:endonuclease/exonuclease/phosphatase family metal-dependent hydrolase